MVSKRTESDDDILREAMARFEVAEAAETENRTLALEDIRFVHDENGQWTEEAKKKREGRPCMTFDQTSGALDQIIGDYLKNRPGIKVRAVDSDSDPEIADLYTGLIRNIESNSSARAAYKTGFKFAATCGYGVWRVATEYAYDDTFDQDIHVRPVRNPFTVLFDPAAQEVTKHDGLFAFVHETLRHDDFEAQYPKASLESFHMGDVGNNYEGWYEKDTVRVAEYWRKRLTKKTILLLSTGETVDADEVAPVLDELETQGITVQKERVADCWKVEWFKLTATQILDRGEWASKYIPLVPVYGKTINIEGEEKYRGLVRKAKDAQRSYNYHRSQSIELVALQPKAPFMATPAMLAGLEADWRTMNTSNKPVLFYNPDPKAPGARPTREPPPTVPAALINEAMQAKEDIKAATGIYDASLGMRSNETSGRAILARQAEGDTANYEFTDNFSDSLELTGRILVDLIPKIYDTARVVRVVGEDEAEEFAEINKTVIDQQTLTPVVINDLSRGKYDVTVTTGQAYSTRRMETAEQLTAVMQANPQMGTILADLWIRSLDLVGGEEAIKRVRKMLIQQGVVEPTEEEQAEMPQPPPPDPMQQQMLLMQLQKLQAEIQNEAADTEEKLADADKTRSEAAKTQFEVGQAMQSQQIQQMIQAEIMRLLQANQPAPQNPPSAGFLMP